MCVYPYALPTSLQVIEIETVPLLVNGKVDRQALLKMYENTNNNGENIISSNFILLSLSV